MRLASPDLGAAKTALGTLANTAAETAQAMSLRLGSNAARNSAIGLPLGYHGRVEPQRRGHPTTASSIMSMPVVFVSHGAPDVLLEAPDTLACWRELAARVGNPEAILVVSAHWQERLPTASMSIAPQTVHDFSGFAPELYRVDYPAPGAPELAGKAVSLLAAANIAADLNPDRGFDHGAWVPLSVLYPQARVPVVQLSLCGGGPAAHLALGRALAPLREEGVLILASGGITHNFSWLNWGAKGGTKPYSLARAFADWVAERLERRDLAALLDYREAGNGSAAHPSEEHFLPLLVALGAAEGAVPRRYQPGFTYDALAMDAYLWD